MKTNESILELSGIKREFPSASGCVQALRSASLKVREKEFIALTGPSGSGKSTLLNIAALLDTPSKGNRIFLGKDTNGMHDSELAEMRKYSVGMVFQSYHLLPHRTVLENIMFRFRYLNTPALQVKKLAIEAIELTGLKDIMYRSAYLLSGGEMQRAAIARSIVNRPALLVADEPTGNLDRKSAEAVMKCLSNLNEIGTTILMVTHNESILDYCTRHIFCKDGYVRG